MTVAVTTAHFFILTTIVAFCAARESCVKVAIQKDDGDKLLSKIFDIVQTSSRQAGYGLIKFEGQNEHNLNENKYGFVSFEGLSSQPVRFEDESSNHIDSSDGNTGNNDIGDPQSYATFSMQENIGQISPNPHKKKKRRRRKPRLQQNSQYPGYPNYALSPGHQGQTNGLGYPQHQYPYAGAPGYSSSFYRPPRRSQSTWVTVLDALSSVTANDDFQCLPMLICQAAARGVFGNSTLTQFSTLNALIATYGSLSSSPIIVFGRAALLGMTARNDPDSCSPQYPRCPSDPQELVHYLNNHNGGFFRFFNSPDLNSIYSQIPYAQNKPNSANNLLSHLAPQFQNIGPNYGLFQPSLQYAGPNQQSMYGFQNQGLQSTDDIQQYKYYSKESSGEGNFKRSWSDSNEFDDIMVRSRRSIVNSDNSSKIDDQQTQQQNTSGGSVASGVPPQQIQGIPPDIEDFPENAWPLLNETTNTWFYPNSKTTDLRSSDTGEPLINFGEMLRALESVVKLDDRHCFERMMCESAASNSLNVPKELLTDYDLEGLQKLSPTLGAALKYGFEHYNKGYVEPCSFRYPDCPDDPMHFLHYMRQHRGGLMKFFSDPNWASLYNKAAYSANTYDGSQGPVLQFYTTPQREKLSVQHFNKLFRGNQTDVQTPLQHNQNQQTPQNYQYGSQDAYPNSYQQSPQNNQFVPPVTYQNQYQQNNPFVLQGMYRNQDLSRPQNYQNSFLSQNQQRRQNTQQLNYGTLAAPQWTSSIYNSYQMNYANLYPGYRRVNMDNNNLDLNNKFKIQKRIQNNYNSAIFAEETENKDKTSKWKFPEVIFTTYNKERGGKRLQFSERDTKREKDVTKVLKQIVFPEPHSKRQYFFPKIPKQDGFFLQYSDDIIYPNEQNDRDHRSNSEDDGVDIVYIVRGNGDPYNPEIVKLKPGENLIVR